MSCPRCYTDGYQIRYGSDGFVRCLQCNVRYQDQPRDPDGKFGTGKENIAQPVGKGVAAGVDTSPQQQLQQDLITPPPQPPQEGQAVTGSNWAWLIAQNPDGGSFNAKDASTPKPGSYMVGGLAPSLVLDHADPTAGDQMKAFSDLHPEAPFIGWWTPDKGPDKGKLVVDASQAITDKFEAAVIALEHNQEAIYGVGTGKDGANEEYQSYGSGVAGAINDQYHAPKLGPRIHPGSTATDKVGIPANVHTPDQIVGTDIPVNMNSSSMSGYSDMAQAAILAKAGKLNTLDGQPLTMDVAKANLQKVMDTASMQDILDGLVAYAQYNAVAEQISHDNPSISGASAAAMIGATCRQTKLGSNLAGAAYIAKMVSTDQVINLPDAVVKAANEKAATAHSAAVKIKNHVPLSQVGDRMSQARAVMATISLDPNALCDPKWGANMDGSKSRIQLSCTDGGVADAIDIARGGAVDKILNGMKQRSFTNNINDPEGPDDVTMDGFMVGISMGYAGHDPYNAPTGSAMSSNVTMERENNKNGIYPMIADAVRQVTADTSKAHGVQLVPGQGQAVLWIAGGGGATSVGTPPTRDRVPRPSDTLLDKWKTPNRVPAAQDFATTPTAAQKTTTESEIEANSVANYKPVADRPLMDYATVLAAAQKELGSKAVTPQGSIYGVQCKDGTTAVALLDQQSWSVAQDHPDAVPEAKIQHALSTVAGLYERDGLGLTHAPVISFVGPNSLMAMTGGTYDDAMNIRGMTSPAEPGIINFNTASLSYNMPAAAGDKGFTMPVGNAPDVGGKLSVEYTITHEYGHLTEFAHDILIPGEAKPLTAAGLAVKLSSPALKSNAAFKAANKLAANLPPHSGLSEYGKSNAHEAYAECFAEFTLTGGKTTNPVAQAYAKEFGWAKPQKLAPGSTPTQLPGFDSASAGDQEAHMAASHSGLPADQHAAIHATAPSNHTHAETDETKPWPGWQHLSNAEHQANPQYVGGS